MLHAKESEVIDMRKGAILTNLEGYLYLVSESYKQTTGKRFTSDIKYGVLARFKKLKNECNLIEVVEGDLKGGYNEGFGDNESQKVTYPWSVDDMVDMLRSQNMLYYKGELV